MKNRFENVWTCRTLVQSWFPEGAPILDSGVGQISHRTAYALLPTPEPFQWFRLNFPPSLVP